MQLIYRRSLLESSINLKQKTSLIHIYVSTPLVLGNDHDKPMIKGHLPLLVTSITSKYLAIAPALVTNCHYMSSMKVISMCPCKGIKINKRVRVLSLILNRIRCMASCYSSVLNVKTQTITITPSSLLRLTINDNPVFRLVLVSSLTESRSYGCGSLKEIRYRESIVSVSRFMAHNKKLRTKQRSIRRLKISFPLTEIHTIDLITIGGNGVYNDFVGLSLVEYL